MKKVLCLCFLLASLSLHAQVNFGFSGGVNTLLHGDVSDNFGETQQVTPGIGWGANLAGGYRFNAFFGVQITLGVQELNITYSKMLHFESDTVSTLWTIKDRFRYGNCSALAEIAPFDAHRNFVLRAGPVLSFAPQGRRLADGPEAGMLQHFESPLIWDSKNIGVAACLALGETIRLSEQHFITLELRYQHTIKAMDRLKNIYPLQLSVGYCFEQ